MTIEFTVANRGLLPGEEGGVNRLYPRLRSNVTTDVVEFQKHATWGSAMTPANLTFALGELQRIMIHEFRMGHAVSLPGIGTFRLTLKGSIEIVDGNFHGRDVRVEGLQFVPDRELRSEVCAIPVRQKPYSSLVVPMNEEVERRLTALFQKKESITHKDVSIAFEIMLTPHRVSALLHRLAAEGRLLREGSRSQTRYYAAPGHFGRSL